MSKRIPDVRDDKIREDNRIREIDRLKVEVTEWKKRALEASLAWGEVREMYTSLQKLVFGDEVEKKALGRVPADQRRIARKGITYFQWIIKEAVEET